LDALEITDVNWEAQMDAERKLYAKLLGDDKTPAKKALAPKKNK
jgi:hypothetical protein